jgi:ADP-ribose diphosphatase
MTKPPDILSQRTLTPEEIAQRLPVEELHLRFNNGVERHYRRLQNSGRGTVLIVPVADADTVLLIREYSAGTHRYELQLPKGRVDPGETPLQAANRELKEEVGKGARQLKVLNRLTAMPGFMSHSTDIVLAQDLYDEKLVGDEPEEIEVVPWRFSNLQELINRDDCSEARSIAALYIARDYLHGGAVDDTNR